jgi:hypothetical protein
MASGVAAQALPDATIKNAETAAGSNLCISPPLGSLRPGRMVKQRRHLAKI